MSFIKGLFGPPSIDKLAAKHDSDGIVKALSHKEYAVRKDAVRALAKLRDASTVEPLICALKDTHFDLRDSVARTLGEMGDARAVEPLISALGDKEGSVRCCAVISLGEIGDARAIKPLVSALEDDNENVCCAVVGALRRLGKTLSYGLVVNALLDGQHSIQNATNSEHVKISLDDRRFISPLMDILLTDVDAPAHKDAAFLIGKVYGPGKKQTVSDYIAEKQGKRFGAFEMLNPRMLDAERMWIDQPIHQAMQENEIVRRILWWFQYHEGLYSKVEYEERTGEDAAPENSQFYWIISPPTRGNRPSLLIWSFEYPAHSFFIDYATAAANVIGVEISDSKMEINRGFVEDEEGYVPAIRGGKEVQHRQKYTFSVGL